MAEIHSQKKHTIPIYDDISANTLVALGHSSVRTHHDLPKRAQNDDSYLLIQYSVQSCPPKLDGAVKSVSYIIPVGQ